MRYLYIVICLALTLFPKVSLAEIYTYGDWKVDVRPLGVVVATTKNESGNEFGRVCIDDGQYCSWALLGTLSCKTNDQFPVLVNAASGSFQLWVKCAQTTKGGGYLFMFTTSEELDDSAKTDPNIGIAFPLKNGRFLVMRFSMAGSDKAIKQMEAIMLNAKPSTKDSIL